MVGFIKLIIFGFCVAGCSYQMMDLVDYYLQYHVISEVHIVISPEFFPPNMLCFNMHELDIFHENMTVRAIFQNTPFEDVILDTCLMRSMQDASMELLGKSDCQERLSISKRLSQNLICYLIENKYEQKMSLDLAYSHDHPQILYSVNLNTTALKGSNQIKLIATEPFVQRDFQFGTLELRYLNSDRITAIFGKFRVTHQMLTTNKLPSPYSTNCLNYDQLGLTGKLDCRAACYIERFLSNFSLLPYEADFIQIPYNSSVFIAKNMNDTIRKQARNIYLSCNAKCFQDDCILNSSLTSSESLSEDASYRSKKLQIESILARFPSYEIIYKAQFSFSSLLIYVLSLMGTWFGISIAGAASLIFKLKNTSCDHLLLERRMTKMEIRFKHLQLHNELNLIRSRLRF